MREALGHIHGQTVLRRKLDGNPSAVGRRFRAHIDNHVVDRAHGAADQLRLRMRSILIVHAAQGSAFLVEGNAALSWTEVDALPIEFMATVRAGKKTALIHIPLRFDEVSALQDGFGELHCWTVSDYE